MNLSLRLNPRAFVLAGAVLIPTAICSAESQPTYLGYASDGMHGAPSPISADEAYRAEQQLAANPEDSEARGKLLKFYWFSGARSERLALIFWLIQHHPESDLHQYQTAGIFPEMPSQTQSSWYPGGFPMNDASDYARAEELWRHQMELHPNDPNVLFNAARTLGFAGSTQIELIERAQMLDPARFTTALSQLYSQFLSGQREDKTMQATVAAHLMASRDVSLIAATSAEMLQRASQQSLQGSSDSPALGVCDKIMTLIRRGKELDPENPRWSDMLQGANQLTRADATPSKPKASSENHPPRIRIGGGVAVGSQLFAPPPIYPVEAKAEGIEGTVKFTVLIAPDGHVSDVKLTSGPPLLVDAAKSAVSQYTYRPVMVQGQAAEVITTVDVPFVLQR